MDFITPLLKTARGNAGLFAVVDRLSKLICLAATPEQVDAPQVSQLFHSNVYRLGTMVSLKKPSPTGTHYL
jgi:hypothetical protein